MNAPTLKERIVKIACIGRPGMIRLVLHLVAIAIICFVAGFGILALSNHPSGTHPFTIVNESAFASPVVSTVPLDNATSAEISISTGIGELRVHPGQNALLSTTVYVSHGGVQPVIETDMAGTKKIVKISEMSGHPFYAQPLFVTVTDQVPVALFITSGPGEATLELGDLELTSLRATMGMGDQIIDIAGYQGADFNATIVHHMGDLTIRVPVNRDVRIHLDKGPGDVHSSGFTQAEGAYVTTGNPGIEISVIQGVGDVRMEAV